MVLCCAHCLQHCNMPHTYLSQASICLAPLVSRSSINIVITFYWQATERDITVSNVTLIKRCQTNGSHFNSLCRSRSKLELFPYVWLACSNAFESKHKEWLGSVCKTKRKREPKKSAFSSLLLHSG